MLAPTRCKFKKKRHDLRFSPPSIYFRCLRRCTSDSNIINFVNNLEHFLIANESRISGYQKQIACCRLEAICLRMNLMWGMSVPQTLMPNHYSPSWSNEFFYYTSFGIVSDGKAELVKEQSDSENKNVFIAPVVRTNSENIDNPNVDVSWSRSSGSLVNNMIATLRFVTNSANRRNRIGDSTYEPVWKQFRVHIVLSIADIFDVPISLHCPWFSKSPAKKAQLLEPSIEERPVSVLRDSSSPELP